MGAAKGVGVLRCAQHDGNKQTTTKARTTTVSLALDTPPCRTIRLCVRMGHPVHWVIGVHLSGPGLGDGAADDGSELAQLIDEVLELVGEE